MKGKGFLLGFIVLTALVYAGAVSASTFIGYDTFELAYDSGKTNCTAGTETSTYNIGYDNTQYQFVQWVTIPVNTTITSVDVYLKKQGTPADQLQAAIFSYNISSDGLGYSNSNWVASSTAQTISASAIYSFAFTDTELDAGTYVVALKRTAATSTTNYYLLPVWGSCLLRTPQSGSTNVFTRTNSNAYVISSPIYFSIYGDVVVSTDGGTCDMASTTEAIYAVGYSMQIYLLIFVLVLAGIAAYRYTRMYI